MKTHQANLVEADNGHFYEIQIDELTKKLFKSSTTILQAYPLDPSLKQFFLDNTAEQIAEKLSTAGMEGSKIHNACHLILNGQTLSPYGITEDQLKSIGTVPPDKTAYKEKQKKYWDYMLKPFNKKEDKALKGFMNFCADFRPIPMELEKIYYSLKHEFAGTADFLGYIHVDKKYLKGGTAKNGKAKKPMLVPGNDKLLILIDWKSGKGVYLDYHLQTASYWAARKEMGLKKNFLVSILHLGTAHKSKYNFILVEDVPKRFKDFLRTKDQHEMAYGEARPEMYSFSEEYSYQVDSKSQVKLIKQFYK